jgi:hypothetical protein
VNLVLRHNYVTLMSFTESCGNDAVGITSNGGPHLGLNGLSSACNFDWLSSNRRRDGCLYKTISPILLSNWASHIGETVCVKSSCSI